MLERFSAIMIIGSLLIGAVELSRTADDKITSEAFPRTLSEFGFFENGNGLKPNDQLISYDLKSPLFSDYSEKLRYIYIADGKFARANGDGLIDFPVGSAIIKTFAYPQNGNMKLIETRVLLRREEEWVALPYVWNDTQDEAVLKLAGKRLKTHYVDDGGKTHNINYAVPNKNQCKECHGLNNVVTPIGPKIRNLAPESLEHLLSSGKLKLEGKDIHPKWDDSLTSDLDRDARAYLDINCAHCHNRQGSASNSGLFLNYEESDPVAYGIYKRPVAAGRGSGGLKFSIDPAKPNESIIIHRMKSAEAGVAMPQIGRSIVHDEGVALISNWIEQMDADKYSAQ